ncbi:MAG: hypothetical protein RLZZ241_1697 [Bacteroidota bacterium]|jgi:hypothetical protein
MKRSFWASIMVFILAFIFYGCGSTKITATGGLDRKLSAKAVIKNYTAAFPQFRTLNGRLAVDYSDGTSSQSVTVTLRMKRDEIIWLSAPLGVIKVNITPGQVSYYNKLQNEYFEGDFTFLSQLLGADLDFEKLQNLLLGQAIVDLRENRYALGYTDTFYELKPTVSESWIKLLFQVAPGNFKLAMQQLAQPEANRIMEVKYPRYQQVEGQFFPEDLSISAGEQTSEVQIHISYKQLEINKSLSFPYKIPKGFNPIEVK